MLGGADLRFSLDYLIQMLYTVPVLLIALPFHELSHAFAAKKLGDNTAKMMGRLTMNPFKHLDVFGTICLILFRFGWAKPVPVDPRNFKNPKAGMAVTALAGPLGNLFLGFVSTVLLRILYIGTNGSDSTAIIIIANILYYSAWINIGLCIFNLIPLPPLDGEKILVFFLPPSVEMFFERYGMFFQIILLLILFTPILTTPLSNMVTNVYTNFNTFISFIVSLF